MSWIQEKPEEKTWLQKCCASLLKSGPIPHHVAFIMDGNRRFAKKNSMDRAEGHLQGFNKLAETLDWCLDLGITEVTVYAFSIENFKRSKDEVDALMEIARQKFVRLMQERELIQKHGVSIRVLGNLQLLPRDIQEIIAEAVDFSKNNNRAILNVCFAYTSREEICAAMRETAEGVQLGLIKESDINESLLEQCLYTNKSPDPDLLVRTSGEVRLSDFLLWQSCYSVLSFMQVLWPEFSVWHLYGGILHYQMQYKKIKAKKEYNLSQQEELDRESDYQCVMTELEQEKRNLANRQNENIKDRVHRYTMERKERVCQFLQHVENKRTSYTQSLLQNKRQIMAVPCT